jgi:shikimate dehydrogenase
MDDSDAPYAEVIGDPIGHSLSPIIHNHWLEQLGLAGSYRPQRCAAGGVEAHLERRRRDPLWRGCNVTMPLKEEAAALLPGDHASRYGAVNLITRSSSGLLGLNTDVKGIGAALGESPLGGKRAVIIGAGGSARAAIAAAGAVRGANVTVLARNPAKAGPLRKLADEVSIEPLNRAAEAIAGAAAVINASPLGMDGGPKMPDFVVAALAGAERGAVAVDLVYRPLETPFLKAAAAAQLRTADGLTVLIGQARPAFEAFFGAPPPPGGAALRALLLRKLRAG